MQSRNKLFCEILFILLILSIGQPLGADYA